MELIVFDLDHTLFKVNSSFRFGLFLYRKKFFSFWKLLACLSDYARHKWLNMSIQKLHAHSFSRLFKGHALSEILLHVDQFLTENFSSYLNESVVDRLKTAQDLGHQVMILSSSPDFLVGQIARRLCVDHWKATTYSVNSLGKFSTISHVMQGKDKADYIQKFAQEVSLPLSALTVYTDCSLDLPMLKIAGNAIGVNPDAQLKRICLHEGWEIIP